MPDEIVLAGLNRVGLSIALALRTPKLEVSLAGYDPDRKVAREAVKAKQIDRDLGSLREASPLCDLCILSLPPEAAIPALEALGGALPEGALILGTSPIQSHVVTWAKDHLPAGRHYVGIVPVEGPSAVDRPDERDPSPSADRFAGGVMALAVPPGTPQAAIDVALSLASILGARPFFIEPAELDAAMSVAETLPALLAAALMSMSSRQPGWRDARRLTGPTFAGATALIEGGDSTLGAARLLLERTPLLAKLDALQAEISEWRTLIEAGEEDPLRQRLEETARGHAAWLAARRKGDWGGEEMSPAPPLKGPSMLERMFGLGRRRGNSSGA